MEKINSEYLKLLLASLCAVSISIGFGRFAYTPILPQMQEDLNLNSALMGSIASWNYFGYLVGSIIPLFLNLNKSLREILIFSVLLTVLTIFFMGITQNIILLILLRFIAGISSALTFIIGTSIIISSANIIKYKINLQLIPFSGIGLGIFLGTIIIWIASMLSFDWRLQWISVSVLGLLFCLPIYLFMPSNLNKESSIEKEAESPKKLNLSFLLISLGYALFGLGYIIFGTFISALARNTPELLNFQYISWIIVGISAMPSVIIWQYISKKIGGDLSLSLACLTTALGIILIIYDNSNFFSLVMSCFLYGIGVPGSVALVLLEGKKRFKGSVKTSVTILTTSFSIGQISGPYMAGIIIDYQYSYIGSMYLSALCLSVSGMLMIDPKRYKF